MNYEKVGSVIYQLRKESAMTQQELADKLFISNKALSKWERGQGCSRRVAAQKPLRNIWRKHRENTGRRSGS